MTIWSPGVWNNISARIGSSDGSARLCGSAMGSTREIDGKGSSCDARKPGDFNGGVDAFDSDEYVEGISSVLSSFLGCRPLRARRLKTHGTRAREHRWHVLSHSPSDDGTHRSFCNRHRSHDVRYDCVGLAEADILIVGLVRLIRLVKLTIPMLGCSDRRQDVIAVRDLTTWLKLALIEILRFSVSVGQIRFLYICLDSKWRTAWNPK